MTNFESIRMLVAGPSASVWIEEKTLFIFIRDIVVQVLGNGKLSVELLFEFSSVVRPMLFV